MRELAHRISRKLQIFGARLEAFGSLVWHCFFPWSTLLFALITFGFTGQWREVNQTYFLDDPNAIRNQIGYLIVSALWATALWYGCRAAIRSRIQNIASSALQRSAAGEVTAAQIQAMIGRTPAVTATLGFVVALTCLLVHIRLYKPDRDANEFLLLLALTALIFGYARLFLIQHSDHATPATKSIFFPLIVGAIVIAISTAPDVTTFVVILCVALAPYFLGAGLYRFGGRGPVGRWGLITASILGICVILYAQYKLSSMSDPRDYIDIREWIIALFSAMLPTIIALLAAGIYAGTRWAERSAFGSREHLTLRINASVVEMLLTTGAITFVLAAVVAFAFAPVETAKIVTAPFIVLIALSSWSVLGTWLFVCLPIALGLRALPFAPIVVAVIISPFANNHHLRQVKVVRSDPPPRFESVTKHFSAWRAEVGLKEGDPIFVVAAAGGGIRAAYWTALALAKLEDRSCGRFGDRAYALSGVSGGSLGLVVYMAARHEIQRRRESPPETCAQLAQSQRPTPTVDLVRRFFESDFLSPVLGSMLFPDTLQRFLPAIFQWGDRATVLADSFDAAWRRIAPGSNFLSQPFLDFYWGDAEGSKRALMMLNATRVEDGRRIVATPVRLNSPHAYWMFEKRLRTDGLSVTDAVTNSARFTYVAPAGSYFRVDESGVEGRAGQLIDGGYVENSGAATAEDVLDQLQHGLEPVDRKFLSNLWVILLDNDPGNDPDFRSGGDLEQYNVCDQSRRSHPLHVTSSRGILEDTFAPFLGLYQSRSSRAGQHQSYLLEKAGTLRNIAIRDSLNIAEAERERAIDAAARLRQFVRDINAANSSNIELARKLEAALSRTVSELLRSAKPSEARSEPDAEYSEKVLGDFVTALIDTHKSERDVLEAVASMRVRWIIDSANRNSASQSVSAVSTQSLPSYDVADPLTTGGAWYLPRQAFCGFYRVALNSSNRPDLLKKMEDAALAENWTPYNIFRSEIDRELPALAWSMSRLSRFHIEAAVEFLVGRVPDTSWMSPP